MNLNKKPPYPILKSTIALLVGLWCWAGGELQAEPIKRLPLSQGLVPSACDLCRHELSQCEAQPAKDVCRADVLTANACRLCRISLSGGTIQRIRRIQRTFGI